MFTKEDLQNIIDQFDEEELKRQGIFGISQYGGGSDESFIRANKEGLELFALELLKSARDTEATLADANKKIIPFGCGLVVIFLVISIIVGLVTLLQWLF